MSNVKLLNSLFCLHLEPPTCWESQQTSNEMQNKAVLIKYELQYCALSMSLLKPFQKQILVTAVIPYFLLQAGCFTISFFKIESEQKPSNWQNVTQWPLVQCSTVHSYTIQIHSPFSLFSLGMQHLLQKYLSFYFIDSGLGGIFLVVKYFFIL